MKIVIIDYGSGNLRSVAKAFEHVAGAENVVVTATPADLETATHIVLPGVGAYGDCAAGLRAIKGMEEALNKQVIELKKPFLGICVGMQLLAETGLEYGEHKGLGWLKGIVKKIEPNDDSLPIPHMGWNSLNILKDSKLTKDVVGDVYFVHSFAMDCAEKNNVVATTTYGSAATAIVEKGNVYGVQFHPEKSQKAGLKILENFVSL
jgi:glutamine amidotransferase